MERENKSVSLFIFHRDFRLDDNLGLLYAISNSENVLPIFILTLDQIKNNPLASKNALQFMYESLIDLYENLESMNKELYIFQGNNIDIIKLLSKTLSSNNYNLNKIYSNYDYTPYAKLRDREISNYCDKNDIKFELISDYTIIDTDDIKTGQGTTYRKFKPFYVKMLQYIREIKIKNFAKTEADKFLNLDISVALSKDFLIQKIKKDYNKDIPRKGGRASALKAISKITSKRIENYEDDKDYPEKNTTLMSAYIKFGNISIREILYVYSKNLTDVDNDLVRQLIWHDFYAALLDSYTEEDQLRYLENDVDINFMRLQLEWDLDEKLFQTWCRGDTGFPFIDAAMRQLNQTGFMHNRGRLVVSNFLSLILHLPWKWGEEYFTQKLYDIDFSSNNGNWQFSAQVGIDSPKVWPRVFNPYQQSKKHDPECEYIKKWVPELRDVSPKDIHNWDKSWEDYDIDYPEPIVDYSKEKEEGVRRYRTARYGKNK